ncbi:MAG: hypothetical protein M0030_17460 [Actinomycetota bacterium]|nr:hypothetical protein [Actinomycetota bacterium]
MNFGEIFRIWRRRLALTAGLTLLVLVAFLAALAWLPRTYQSQASVVLLAPRSVAKQNGGNPYLSFTPSLSLAADALSRAMMSPATVGALSAQGYTEPYTVALPAYTTATTGSVVTVTVTGSDRALVQQTLEGVLTQLGSELTEIQGTVARPDRIRIAPLSATSQADLAVSQTVRPFVIVVVFGLVIALGVPVIVDGRAARRRAVRESSGQSGRAEPLARDMTGLAKS